MNVGNTACEQAGNSLETGAIGKLIWKYSLPAIAISIVLNNVLGHYGELSPYGRDIPLACVGIITKVCALFDGVLWAGPVADGLAGIISLLLVRHEMNRWTCAPK